MGQESGAGPLAGVRVVDFSRVLAGPYATMMLGDFGADVIKVERRTGDETRAWTPPVDEFGRSTYFASVNRNKRSVVWDLTTSQDSAAARELAVTADVLVENFRPGVMDRFGLGYEQLREANPSLVYASVTGFGSGAGAALPGYDLLVQAVGGLMSVTGDENGGPTKAGVAVVDVLAGLNALTGILLALRHKEATGDGQRVEITLLGSLLSGLVNQASGALGTGVAPVRMGNGHPSVAPYDVFRCADRDIAIAVGNDAQFRSLALALGLNGMADDERFASNEQRVAHRRELTELIESRLLLAPAAHWISALDGRSVPAGPINTVVEAMQFADELGLSPTVKLVGTDSAVSRYIANPISLSESPPSYRLAPPLLGEHPDPIWHAARKDHQ